MTDIIGKRNMLILGYNQDIKKEMKSFDEFSEYIYNIGHIISQLKITNPINVKQIADHFRTKLRNTPITTVEIYILKQTELLCDLFEVKHCKNDVNVCILNSEIFTKTVLSYNKLLNNHEQSHASLLKIKEFEKQNNLAHVVLLSHIFRL